MKYQYYECDNCHVFEFSRSTYIPKHWVVVAARETNPETQGYLGYDYVWCEDCARAMVIAKNTFNLVPAVQVKLTKAVQGEKS